MLRLENAQIKNHAMLLKQYLASIKEQNLSVGFSGPSTPFPERASQATYGTLEKIISVVSGENSIPSEMEGTGSHFAKEAFESSIGIMIEK